MILHESDINDVFPKRSKTAIILGNGPSMSRFENVFQSMLIKNPVVIGVNRVYNKKNYALYRPIHYYVAIDRSCWREAWQEIKDLKCYKYFIYERFKNIAHIPRVVYFGLNTNYKEVSRDIKTLPGHNNTSTAMAVQLALMQGASDIHFFGVDCRPEENGKTHNHGNMKRKAKQWKNIKDGIKNIVEHLEKYKIEYTIHSDLYESS